MSAFLLSLTACSSPIESEELVLVKAQDNVLLRNDTLIEPYTFNQEQVTSVDTKAIPTVLKEMDASRSGYSWLISKVSEGKPGYTTTDVRNTYDTKGELLSSETIPGSEVYTDVTPTIYQYGAKVTVGAYFYTSIITRYGYDCVGCNIGVDGAANTAADIKVRNTEVRQADGFFEDGITYEGYYIVAADKAFPFCTVLEIENKNMSGMGLVPSVPFKAIVLDRGGAIKTTHLDLYAGSEKNLSVISAGRTSGLKVTVVDFLSWTRNSYGQKICK